jgi:asparagine synthase (glutamine-hydrolysing)
MYKSNLERDFKICNFHGLELRLPFVTNELVRFALSLPVELKLQPTDVTLRKLVLRDVGRNLGLPRSVVDRPKKAIQYATGVSKILGRTAKSEDLTVKEYLRKVYQTIFPRENVT